MGESVAPGAVVAPGAAVGAGEGAESQHMGGQVNPEARQIRSLDVVQKKKLRKADTVSLPNTLCFVAR